VHIRSVKKENDISVAVHIVFNLVPDCIINKLGIRGIISTKMVHINAYADDVVVIFRNLKALEQSLY
jgi:hypothetical protein